MDPDAAAVEPIGSVNCSLDTGSNLAIAATVLYFMSMLMIPSARVPTPLPIGGDGGGGDGGADGGGDEEGQGGAAAESEE